MELTVIGNWGGCPRNGEAASGYLLRADDRKFMLDFGSGVLTQLGKYCALADIEGVFLTHYHHDHCSDIGCFQYAAKAMLGTGLRKEPVPIYVHNQDDRFPHMTYKEYTVGCAVCPQTTVEREGLRVSFAPTVHEGYNLAMRLEYGGESLVYTGDMGPLSDIDHLCAGADLLVCECCLLEEEADVLPGHMNTKAIGLLAQRTGVSQVMLTHFPHGTRGEIWDDDARLAQLKEIMADEVRKYYSGHVIISAIGTTYRVAV
jgi:ribonuclease BN (tRNA processing enzyme)